MSSAITKSIIFFLVFVDIAYATPRGSLGSILHCLTLGIFGEQTDRVHRKVEPIKTQ